jgi:hypothetical protein
MSYTKFLPVGSLTRKPGVDGIAHDSGENRVMANVSKPGKTGVGDTAAGEGGGDVVLEGGRGISGPPHAVVIFVRAEKARRDVGRSDGVRAKCSMVDIKVSKMA